jgi:diaminopimelate epimerase
MMKVPFAKMSGAGNDMVLIDHRARFLRGSEVEFVRAVCHRRYGVGADGLILLERDREHDFFVRFFNPDGGEYGLCGNGSRCLPRFAREIGLPGPDYVFRSLSGVHRARLIDEGTARVSLSPIRELRFDIPVDLEGEPRQMDWGDIGVPHGALWVEDVAQVPMERWGPHLRYHPAFAPQGTNVSFVQVLGGDRLAIRTYERGIEGETWACGSGSAVVAALAHRKGLTGACVEFRVYSGETLTIRLDPDPTAAPELEGSARWCFEGVLETENLLPAPAGGNAVTA